MICNDTPLKDIDIKCSNISINKTLDKIYIDKQTMQVYDADVLIGKLIFNQFIPIQNR